MLGQGPGTGDQGHGSAGMGTCVVLPAPSWPIPHFQSHSPARRDGWQAPWGSAAPQVIGSLAAPCALAPLLSQVYRTQIRRYQRAAAAGTGPAGCAQPLLSPSLTRSSGWKRLRLGCAARFCLGTTADGHRRQQAGCRAGLGGKTGARSGSRAGRLVGTAAPITRGASPGWFGGTSGAPAMDYAVLSHPAAPRLPGPLPAASCNQGEELAARGSGAL